jgi:hypothetical protein
MHVVKQVIREPEGSMLVKVVPIRPNPQENLELTQSAAKSAVEKVFLLPGNN